MLNLKKLTDVFFQLCMNVEKRREAVVVRDMADTERKVYSMNKVEDLMALIKANDLLKKQEKMEEEKKCNKVLWVFAVVGVIAAVAGIAYALYLYFTPDYLEDFEDEFDDDFDDDFFEDEEEEPVVEVKKAEKASDVEE